MACQTQVHKLYTSQTCSVYTRSGLLNKTACLELMVTVYIEIRHMVLIVTYYHIVHRGLFDSFLPQVSNKDHIESR